MVELINFYPAYSVYHKKKTITTLLNKIPYACGINEHIFDSLKTAAMSEKEQINLNCVLIFDEMSLQPGLQFNKKRGCIDGFVDMGGEFRRRALADHVLVFML